MRPRLIRAGLVALIMLALFWLLVGGPNQPPGNTGNSQSVQSALGETGDMSGYQRATQPRRFSFPADHGAHPGFRNEWWYFTGNLEDPSGRPFGFQLTFFRIALAPKIETSASHWRTRQVYMAHFALSDLASGQFHAFERYGRAAAGIAGTTNSPLSVWLDHWRLSSEHESGFPMRLNAAQDGIVLDLQLTPEKPIVLNGDRGLSQKSASPGNASYYYSMPRLATTGSVTVDGVQYPVSGRSWLDREWSTSALGPDQEGWDWFALQFDDGRELMLYRLRRTDGSADPLSAGTLIDENGNGTVLARDDMVFRILDHWTSERTGIRYPSRWEIELPRHGIRFTVEPKMKNQELDLSFRYWEGSVHVQGRDGDQSLRGKGYMELAGYGA